MLNGINTKILPYITELLDYKFGLREESAIISPIPKTTDFYYEDGYNGFLFTLPGRQKMVDWQFIFDLENLNLPPDIISKDNFYESFDLKIVQKTVPSLEKWDPTNAKCLLQLVLELLQLYQKCQLTILYRHNSLRDYQLHYDCLKKIINPKDIEVEVSVTNPRFASVQFWVGLKFDVSDLPIKELANQIYVAWVSILYQTTAAIPNITIRVHKKLEKVIEVGPLCNDAMDIPFEAIVEDVQLTLSKEIKMFRYKLLKRRELLDKLMAVDSIEMLEVDELISKFSFHVNRDRKNTVCQIEVPLDSTQSARMILLKAKPIIISQFSIYDIDSDALKIANNIVEECKMEVLSPAELSGS